MFFFVSCFFFWDCDMIEYHPYDGNVSGEKHLTVWNIKQIQERCKDKDTIRFAEISDTQRWYDETEELVDAINNRGDVDFVIHCGDQTDFGLTKEFIWMRNIFQRFKMPYVCIIGNHDCLGTGEDVYRIIYGDDNFSFDAGFVHFSCLNTNAFEYDYSVNVPDFNYIQNDIDSISSTITKTVVAMHSCPNSEQFNNNISEYFNLSLNKYPGLLFCLCGHGHRTTIIYP